MHDSYARTRHRKADSQCFDHLDHASLVVELVLRRNPNLGEVATAVVLRRRSLRRTICMYTWRSISSVEHATNLLHVAVLAQCTTIYLAVTRLQLGITPEDYVVTGYESWMEVRLAVLIDAAVPSLN